MGAFLNVRCPMKCSTWPNVYYADAFSAYLIGSRQYTFAYIAVSLATSSRAVNNRLMRRHLSLAETTKVKRQDGAQCIRKTDAE